MNTARDHLFGVSAGAMHSNRGAHHIFHAADTESNGGRLSMHDRGSGDLWRETGDCLETFAMDAKEADG